MGIELEISNIITSDSSSDCNNGIIAAPGYVQNINDVKYHPVTTEPQQKSVEVITDDDSFVILAGYSDKINCRLILQIFCCCICTAVIILGFILAISPFIADVVLLIASFFFLSYEAGWLTCTVTFLMIVPSIIITGILLMFAIYCAGCIIKCLCYCFEIDYDPFEDMDV